MMLAEMGCEVFAIDWSEGMVKQVTENSKERGLKIDIRRMDAQDLDFDDGFFDLVVSSRLVWNLPDPIKAYSEWLRVLKNDGTMVLYDGNYFLKTDGRKAHAPFEDDTEGPQMYQGADFRIIRNVAKELPLSKEVRPAWDVSALTSLGVFTINIHMENYAPTDDGGRKVPSTFVLVVEKERKGDLIE
jgi:SAM-dependent methyltransferase